MQVIGNYLQVLSQKDAEICEDLEEELPAQMVDILQTLNETQELKTSMHFEFIEVINNATGVSNALIKDNDLLNSAENLSFSCNNVLCEDNGESNTIDMLLEKLKNL